MDFIRAEAYPIHYAGLKSVRSTFLFYVFELLCNLKYSAMAEFALLFRFLHINKGINVHSSNQVKRSNKFKYIFWISDKSAKEYKSVIIVEL